MGGKTSPKKKKKKFIGGIKDDSLNQCMREISQIKLLTRDEESKLEEKIHNGSSSALKELVPRNLKYVVTVANKYRGCGLALQDFIEEGNIRLIRATKRFESTRQINLSRTRTVKISIKQAGVLYKVGKLP